MALNRKNFRSHWIMELGVGLDRLIETEIMQSEKLRARFLSIAFLFFAALSALIGLIFRDHVATLFHGEINMMLLAGILGGYAVYETGFHFAVGRFAVHDLRFPWPPKYFNALVEVTLPSLGLLVLLQVFSAERALSLPPVYLYFVFIILSALRLEPRISLFTGLVAAIEFGIIGLWALQSNANAGSMDADTYFLLRGATVAKSIILFVSGLITAFVSWQIRTRLEGLLRSREEQNRLSAIFGQHVSPAVMDRLLHQKDAPESESRNVCILFLDIRNFTSFSQSRSPEEVVEYLNRLFDFMIDIVNRNNGIINKFLGDGFMAVFGAPLPDGSASLHAVQASQEISERLRQEVATGSIGDTKIGIGLHAGDAVTGNVGSLQRREYTIIGDVVNLASRIEQLNKNYNSEILVSDEVWRAIQAQGYQIADAKNLGNVTVKGRDQAVEVWQIK